LECQAARQCQELADLQVSHYPVSKFLAWQAARSIVWNSLNCQEIHCDVSNFLAWQTARYIARRSLPAKKPTILSATCCHGKLIAEL
jgi:hypothetical protein